MSESKRLQILGMIERGEITADEGLRLLQETNHLDEVPTSYEAPPEDRDPSDVGASPAGESSSAADDHFGSNIEIVEAVPAEEPFFEQEDNGYEGAEEAQYSSGDPAQSFPADADKWRRWWMIPLWIGVGIVVISGLFMLWAFQASGLGFWFFCTSVFLALGLVILVLAAQSRSARWLHLRVKQKPGQRPQNIAISFPIPLRFASWIMRIFGRYIPDTKGASPDDILTALDALEESTTPENPIYIKVDDEDGEQVEIYIG